MSIEVAESRQPLAATGRMARVVRWWADASPRVRLCAGIVLLYLLVALFGAALAPYSATEFNMLAVLQPPSLDHPFGTDGFGRDVLSRVLVGARSILTLAALATVLGVGSGCALGLASGYFGGLIDEVLMRLVDVLLALPGLLLALLILTSLGPSDLNLVASIAIVFIPKSARVARGAVLPLRNLGFVEAARLRGAGWPVIVFRELLPNLRGEVGVEFCLRFAYALLLISSLGFLGFGVQPPHPDWGLMISESRNFITVAPWAVLFPALAIGTIVVAVNVLADGLSTRSAGGIARYL